MIPLGLPLRTRNTIAEVKGVLLYGQTGLPVGRQQIGLVVNRVDIVGQPQRYDVGLQSVDHRARLFARAAMGLVDCHHLAGLRLPIGGKCRVVFLVEFASGVIRDIENRLLVAGGGRNPGRRHNGGSHSYHEC